MPRRLPAGYPAEAPPSAQNRHFRPPSADPAAGAARSTSADGHRRGGGSSSGGWMPRPPRRRRDSEQFRPPPGPGRGGATEHRGVRGPACERRSPSPCPGSMFDRHDRRERPGAAAMVSSGWLPPRARPSCRPRSDCRRSRPRPPGRARRAPGRQPGRPCGAGSAPLSPRWARRPRRPGSARAPAGTRRRGRDDQRTVQQQVDDFTAECRKVLHPAESGRPTQTAAAAVIEGVARPPRRCRALTSALTPR